MARVVNPTILPRHTFWVSDVPYIKSAPANSLPVAANPLRNQPELQTVRESFVPSSDSNSNSIELLRPFPKLYSIAKQMERDEAFLKEVELLNDADSDPLTEPFVDTVPASFPEDRHMFYANRVARDPRYTPKTHWSMQQKTFHRKLNQYIEFFYYCKWYQVACKLRRAWEAARRAVVSVAKTVAKAATTVAKAVTKAATSVATFAKNTYNNVKGAIGGCCRRDQSRFGLNCGLNCSKMNPPMTDWGLFCGRGGKVKAKHTFGKSSRAKEREVMFGSDIEYGDD
jgi:hypothetical protein